MYMYLYAVIKIINYDISCLDEVMQGIKLTFFSSSHLGPKYFKVVANYKSSTFTRSVGKV